MEYTPDQIEKFKANLALLGAKDTKGNSLDMSPSQMLGKGLAVAGSAPAPAPAPEAVPGVPSTYGNGGPTGGVPGLNEPANTPSVGDQVVDKANALATQYPGAPTPTAGQMIDSMKVVNDIAKKTGLSPNDVAAALKGEQGAGQPAPPSTIDKIATLKTPKTAMSYGGPAPLGGQSLVDKYLKPYEKDAFALQGEQAGRALTTTQKNFEAQAVEGAKAQETMEQGIAEQKAKQAEIDRLSQAKAAYSKDELDKESAMNEALSKTEIDPRRFWKSMDLGGQISTGISLMLGGMASAFTGGISGNMMQLNKQIDQDLMSQKENYDHKLVGLKSRQGIFAARMQAFGDEQMALLSSKNAALDVVKQKIQSMAAGMASEVAANNAKDAMLQIDEQQKKIQIDMQTLAGARFDQHLAAAAAAQAAAKAKQQKLMDEFQKKDMEGAFEKAKELGGQVKYTEDGRFVIEKGGSIVWDGTKSGDAAGKTIQVKQYAGLKNGEPVYTYGSSASLNSKQAEKHNEAASKLGEIDALEEKFKNLNAEYGTELTPWTSGSKLGKQYVADAKAAGVNLPEGFDPTAIGDQKTTWKEAFANAKAKLKSELQVHEIDNANAPAISLKEDTGEEPGEE